MSDLTFFTNPMSRGRIVRWMLDEVGADYATEIIGYGDSMKSPAYLAINPMGKVPAIRHRGTVVTEVAAICAYLADAFPEAGLAPDRGSAERGPYYRFLFFAAGPIEAVMTIRALEIEVPSEKERMVGFGTYARVLDTIEHHFSDGRRFVTGDAFSAADVYLAAQLGWGMQFGTIDERPGFRDYVDRCQQRPAYAAAAARDDAAAAG